MPERRGGRRKLNITSCVHAYKGTNSKGEFNIYEVEATTEAGVVIQDKLTSWAQLPTGVAEYDLTPYEKDGVFKSWTVEVPKERGGNSGAAKEAMEQRVGFLEQQVEFLVGKVNALDGAISQLGREVAQPATPVAAPSGNGEDDIPFRWEGPREYAERYHANRHEELHA